MRKFKGSRKLDEVIEKAKELDYEYYEKNFQQRFRKGDLDICLRSFGKFHVYKDGECIATHKSDEFVDAPRGKPTRIPYSQNLAFLQLTSRIKCKLVLQVLSKHTK